MKRLSEQDRSEESPNSPRNVMNAFYFKPPFRVAPEREEIFVDAMLKMQVSDGAYPGDMRPSENWPNVRPGTQGVNNAISPGTSTSAPSARSIRSRRCSGCAARTTRSSQTRPFWTSARWASLGYVPGWPGDGGLPVAADGLADPLRARSLSPRTAGSYTEVVVADCGHSPLIEKPEEFRQRFFAFRRERVKRQHLSPQISQRTQAEARD